METFISLLAKDIIQKFGNNFSTTTIVFPNKRAGLFLSEDLAKHIKSAIWMPRIITLSEFIEENSDSIIADELYLIIKLYKSFQKISGLKEDFDKFYFWGKMLISDFDNIDKYQINAKHIFSNLEALKDIENSFPYLSKEDIEIIKSFWSSFEYNHSEEQEKFLSLWKYLYNVYLDFRGSLSKSGRSYEGMAQRKICDNLENIALKDTFIFAGFNALSKCEEKILGHLQKMGKAVFYWDYDLYYTNNMTQEAGLYIRENIIKFPNQLGKEHFNNLTYTPQNIEYISTTSAIGVTKVIPEVLNKMNNITGKNTAIVLCDESLLIPVIYSINTEVGKINITMGYPGANTGISSLIIIISDIKRYIKADGQYFYYKFVISVLENPIIDIICHEEARQIIAMIRGNNMIYVNIKLFNEISILKYIFSLSTTEPPEYILGLLNLINNTLNNIDEVSINLEKEFVFHILAKIKLLNNTIKTENLELNDKMYFKFIKNIIRNISIPFSGEPLQGIQVMGLMETRMLDFDNLIILSANEGILPQSGIENSYVPYSLRKGFGMPTPEHRDSIFAYYFYRLIQRAKDIRIIYSSRVKGTKTAEMSRFLYQLKYESGLEIKEKQFIDKISINNIKPIYINKDEVILNKLDEYTNEGKALSPSALNIYLECQLRFYFNYIAGIKEADKVEEDIDARVLGNILHNTMERLYKPYNTIDKDIISRILKDDIRLDKLIKDMYDMEYQNTENFTYEKGVNDIILTAIKRYIQHILNYDIKHSPFSNIKLETKRYTSIRLNGKNIYIGGKIDRMDIHNDNLRVIDYKTGGDTPECSSLVSIFDRDDKKRNKAVFQALLYSYVLHNSNINTKIIPGIYNVKSIANSYEYDHRIEINKNRINDFSTLYEEFESELSALIKEIYNPEVGFSQTNIEEKCVNCIYNTICRRV